MKQAINTSCAGILIPTCDRPHYLEAALRSACEQSIRACEIIVIDNGSTDAAGSLISRVNDPRVRYIRNEQNLGLIGSIRKGMQLFSDKVSWCTILPDDDLLDRDFIGSMLEFTERHAGSTVVHGHYLLIDAQGTALGETSLPPERESAVEYLIGRSRFVRQTFLAGVFFARHAYEQVGGYPQFTTGMASDDALLFALSLKQGLYFNKQAIASVRMHPDAESHSSSNVHKHIQAFGDYQDYILRISEADDQLSIQDRNTIRQALNQYIRISINGLWIHRVQDLLSGTVPSRKQELSWLYALVGSRNLPFSLRVRIDALCAKYFNWCPELNPRYRRFWEDRHRRKTQQDRS